LVTGVQTCALPICRAFGKDPLPPAVREGARVFTFARNDNLSHAGQFACASCHFEGTEDKLVWVISDGPRQTPALAGRLAGTAPFNWAGTKDSLKDNMSQTVERMGGLGLTLTELEHLEQFLLHGLETPNNPNLAPDGALTADQLAGKALFESNKTGCAGCHQPERNFTDGLSHDVGTGNETERIIHEIALAADPEARPPWHLDTPTLKGLFYTAPYFHDGSAPDLWAVLEREGSRMGQTSHLTYLEKKQLIAYLLTL
jgi:cytochrome c peroxidase